MENIFKRKFFCPKPFPLQSFWNVQIAVFARWVGLVVLLTLCVWMKLLDLVSSSLDGTWFFKDCCYSDICHWLREVCRPRSMSDPSFHMQLLSLHAWTSAVFGAVLAVTQLLSGRWMQGRDCSHHWHCHGSVPSNDLPNSLGFPPNKWWANTGNLFTAHCMRREGLVLSRHMSRTGLLENFPFHDVAYSGNVV